ncbi:ParA family partition ATPase [Oceanibium sediminis]|uniref:ParA family partition ATPase n=1 Tax=Oceanibium sediminis TaxID=2026339 RepID=UPI0013006A1F|nr:ParA family partition ATPase [Oceanibium sediminis]
MIIVFAQQKGGAGKTTVLAHLAHAWANGRKSVALVDLDPQRSLSSWAGHQRDHDYTVIESAGWRAGSDIKDMARKHQVTLVDCPGNASNLLEAAVRESDLVLVPCQPSVLDAWASAPVLEMARREKTPARIVLNRVPPRGTAVDMIREVLKEQDAEILNTTLGNRVAFSNGFAAATTALGLARSSPATREVMALMKEVEKLLK